MKKPKYIPEFKDIPSPRAKMPELPLEERHLNFEEVELGLSEEQVLAEASRCLSCRRCIGCGLCLAECDDCAIVYEQKSESLTLEADAIIYAADGDAFNPRSIRTLGYENSANVITSIEFERLASATGPFGGVILRPFDGEVPKRIAFIQCVGSREEGIGANFCSTVCCSRTLSQARRAREVIGDVEVTVIHRGLRPVGKNGEKTLRDIMAEDWAEFVGGAVEEIAEDAGTGTVKVRLAGDGGEIEREFDLVVLAIGARALREFGSIARRAGMKTNRYKFVDLKPGNMLASDGGVYFAGAALGPATGERGIIEAMAAASRALAGVGAVEKRETSDRAPGKSVVFTCRYGLELLGSKADRAEGLTAEGFLMGGTFPFLCYRQGRAAMADETGGGNELVVLGCHKGSHESLFESILGLPPGRVTIAGRDELEKSDKDLAAALKAARGPGRNSGGRGKDRTAAVIGGGVAGLAAASELARRGVSVVVVERGDEIGSFLRGAGDDEDERAAVESFFEAIEASERIEVLKSAKLESFESGNGILSLGIETGKGSKNIEVSAVIVATGAGEYKPDGFLYGKSDAVMSQKDFRAKVHGGEGGYKNVVMLQCVGARDDDHMYCSRYCCAEAIDNAMHYMAANPGAKVTILHRGIRVYGFEEDAFTDAIEKGVQFVEIEGEVGVDGEAGLKVSARASGGEAIALKPDVFVLSLAHTHEGTNRELAGILGAELDSLGFFGIPVPHEAPMNTTKEGVFVCGFARAPVTIVESFNEGLAAAGAACRYIESGG